VPPVKDDLLHVRFGSIGIYTVNTPPNTQGRGLHSPRRGATTLLQRLDKTMPDRRP
jgi:hypothetical protein